MSDFADRQRRMLGPANASPANTSNVDQRLSGREAHMPLTYLNAKNHGNAGSQRTHTDQMESALNYGLRMRGGA